MTALRALPRDLRVLAALAAAGLALATAVALMRFGLLGVALPVAVVCTLTLIERPKLAIGLLLATLVLFEQEDALIPALSDALYFDLPLGVQPIDGLLLIALVSVVLARRAPAPALPRPLILMTGLVCVAIPFGFVVGHHGGFELFEAVAGAKALTYLIVVPWLVIAVIRERRDALTALAGVAILAIAKAGLGLADVFVLGRGTQVDGSVITFYEPAANLLLTATVLVIVAAWLLRARLPGYALAALPFVTAALVLSYRRSFWIGAVLGLLLVVLLGLSPMGRRLLVPVLVLLAAGVWFVSTSGFQASGPLAERARSLEPSSIQRTKDDRYRFDERANIIGEIRRHPVTGLGLGVRWHAYDRPLAVERGRRQYVHFAVLWWWLRLGLLGAIAYAVTIAVGLWLAGRAWRRQADPRLRALGLGALATFVAVMVVETTATFTGVDIRYTALVGALLGLLGALTRFEPVRS